MKSRTRYQIHWLFYAALAAAFWGLNYVLEEKLLETFSVLQMLFFSSSFITVLMGGYCYFFGLLPGRNFLRTVHKRWLVIMMVSHVAAIYLILLSIQMAAAHQAAIVEISYPLFTVLFTWLLFKVKIHWSFFVGGGLILGGSYIIIL